MTTLYHGSHESDLTVVRDDGVFGGVFASAERRVAESHGDHVYSIEIDDDAICTTQHLNYHADVDAISAAIAAEGHNPDDEMIWSAVVDDNDSLVWERVEASDAAELSWELQRVRGRVAAALGFSAVEMSDEHGTSYLVLPGAELRRC